MRGYLRQFLAASWVPRRDAPINSSPWAFDCLLSWHVNLEARRGVTTVRGQGAFEGFCKVLKQTDVKINTTLYVLAGNVYFYIGREIFWIACDVEETVSLNHDTRTVWR